MISYHHGCTTTDRITDQIPCNRVVLPCLSGDFEGMPVRTEISGTVGRGTNDGKGIAPFENRPGENKVPLGAT